jgi:hypothetical protein
MNELTDLEICQRIAKIEGLEISCEWDCGNNGILIGKGDGDLEEYNPLTDDALCFKLMIKYKVWRWSNPAKGKFNACIKNVAGWVSAETLNKAICLAIIEAHK